LRRLSCRLESAPALKLARFVSNALHRKKAVQLRKLGRASTDNRSFARHEHTITCLTSRIATRFAPGPREQLGVWGPGIRWMRRMHFTAKAIVVSLAVVLPLLALMGCWSRGTDQVLQRAATPRGRHVEVASGLVRWAHAQERPASCPASRRSSWRCAPWPACATAATSTSGSTTCSRAW
jgi:hypothetical protein